MTLGIIDVGTNSIHLLIGILGLNGRFHTILKERDLTRLGEGGLAAGRLTKVARRRAMGVLARYATTLERCRVEHVEAVATSAVRTASNGPAFVREVRRLGIPLRVISGRTEARLIYLGVVQAHRFRGTTLVVTVGGGSAQVIVGNGLHLRYAASIRLGGARLAQQFIRHDPPEPAEIEALRASVRQAWRPVIRIVRRYAWRQAVGSSATIAQLMAAASVRDGGVEIDRWLKKHRLQVRQRQVRELVARLEDSSAEERIQLPGVDPRREDLMLPTGVVLLEWMRGCGIRTMRYAPGSLREGLVIDYLIRHHQRQAQQRFDDPLESVLSSNGGGDVVIPWGKRVLKHLVA